MCFVETISLYDYAARGFHPTDVPKGLSSYGQAQATGDLLALADYLALDSFHLVGTSMGSFTSLDFTLRYGPRVRSLTVIGNSSGPRNDAERSTYRSDWLETEITAREKGGGTGAVAVLAEDPAYRSFRENRPEAWRTYANRLAEQSVAGALNILRTLHWNRRSLWEDEARLRLVDCPVLLVHGGEDYYLVGETNAFLDSVIPQTVLELFPQTGHLVNLERPDKFNTLFCSRIQDAQDFFKGGAEAFVARCRKEGTSSGVREKLSDICQIVKIKKTGDVTSVVKEARDIFNQFHDHDIRDI